MEVQGEINPMKRYDKFIHTYLDTYHVSNMMNLRYISSILHLLHGSIVNWCYKKNQRPQGARQTSKRSHFTLVALSRTGSAIPFFYRLPYWWSLTLLQRQPSNDKYIISWPHNTQGVPCWRSCHFPPWISSTKDFFVINVYTNLKLTYCNSNPYGGKTLCGLVDHSIDSFFESPPGFDH